MCVWGGGGGLHKKIGIALAVLQCDKFNVEGIRSRSTWENGEGAELAVWQIKGGEGGRCTPQKMGEGIDGYSWSRRDVTAYMTITSIKPEILRILRHDIWGTVSVFIVDLNADIRGGFTNLTADYQKLRLEIGVRI